MSEGLRAPDKAMDHNESVESAELFRGTLAFDFIFSRDKDGNKHAYCNEINGHAAGGGSIQSLKGQIDETRRALAKVRFANTPEYYKQMKNVKSDPNISEDEREKRIKVLDTQPKRHAFQNPSFIAYITEDKSAQQEFIPEENRPREYHKGGSPESSTGSWICKPKDGESGKGIKFFDNKKFQEKFLGTDMERDYVAQEVIKSCGADNAPEDMSGNPQSMRLHMDFQYLQNGEIKLVYEIAFQRVSASPDDLIVNIAQGAKAATASEEEIQLAHPIAEQIIHNLAKGYKESLDKGTE